MLPHRTNVRRRTSAGTCGPQSGRSRVGGSLTPGSLVLTLALALAPKPAAAVATSTTAELRGPILTLDEAYRRTRERSEELKTLRERIVEAELNVDRAWALLKPTWNASYNFTHVEPKPPSLDFSIPNLSTPETKMACRIDAMGHVVDPAGCLQAVGDAFGQSLNQPSQTLDLFGQDTSTFSSNVTWNVFNGRAIPAIQSAYDSVDAERDRTRSSTLDLLLSVARAYYGATATREAIAAAERSLARAKAELKIAETQAELGESVKARLVASKVAVSQGQNDVRRAANVHLQSLLALWLLTRSEGEQPEVVAPPEPKRPEGDKDALTKLAFGRREDLRAAKTAIRISERMETEAWWRFAPTLALFASYRYSNVAGISGQNDQWSFGLLANLPLYDGGLRYADLASAASRIRAANAALSGLEARVRSDVARAILQLDSAELTLARARDALTLAQTRAEIAETQFKVGALRTIEVKDANDAVLDAELAIIRAELDRQVGVLELQRVVGAFEP